MEFINIYGLIASVATIGFLILFFYKLGKATNNIKDFEDRFDDYIKKNIESHLNHRDFLFADKLHYVHTITEEMRRSVEDFEKKLNVLNNLSPEKINELDFEIDIIRDRTNESIKEMKIKLAYVDMYYAKIINNENEIENLKNQIEIIKKNNKKEEKFKANLENKK